LFKATALTASGGVIFVVLKRGDNVTRYRERKSVYFRSWNFFVWERADLWKVSALCVMELEESI